MKNTLYENVGKRLRAHRKAQQITLKQLSAALGKSLATVSKYEKGEIAVDLEVLVDWCRYLNVDIGTLLPGTKETEVDASRYAGNFADRLYLYSYLGHKNKIHFDVIENDNETMQSTFYLNVADVNDLSTCSFIYSGKVIYSDISTSFVFFNTSPPFDMMTFNVPTLSEDQNHRIGMLSSITFSYRNIAIKVLVSRTPVTDKKFLMEKLLLSQEELKHIRAINFFKI
ncbi:helix-turn-helix transcriptional regulator [Anaerovoracaceae bacterium 42-11]